MQEKVTEGAEVVADVATDVAVAAGGNADKIEQLETLSELMNNTVYMMGFSFILGVVFTIFILMVLDFMRRNKQDDE